MMQSYKYTLSSQAYAVPLLHAAKHHSQTVIGVFLAQPPIPSSSSSNTTSLQIEDAVPLLHLNTSLTPILEAGLEQVEAYAKRKGSIIVGMYECAGDLRGKGKAKDLSRSGVSQLMSIKKELEGAFALTVSYTIYYCLRSRLIYIHLVLPLVDLVSG